MLVCLVVLTLFSSWAAQWLATRTYFGGPAARPPVVVLAPLIAAVLVSTTLAGADADLEGAAPRTAGRWRAGHALISAAVVTAALALSVTDTPLIWGAGAMARNALGLVGMVLLAATVLPRGLAWAPAVGYLLPIYIGAPRQPSAGSQWWAWPMQPSPTDPSSAIALSLLVAGIAAYTRHGPTNNDPQVH